MSAQRSTIPAATAAPHPNAHLPVLVFGRFFILGRITSLNDLMIPKVESLFALSSGGVLRVRAAFLSAYFIVSLPAAKTAQRAGCVRTAVIGLWCMATSCLLFVPASSAGWFGAFLVALFALASAIILVRVTARMARSRPRRRTQPSTRFGRRPARLSCTAAWA